MTTPSAPSTSPFRQVSQWLAPALIVILAVALIVVVLQRDGEAAQPAAAVAPPAAEDADGPVAEIAEPEQQRLEMARRDPEDPLAAGPVDAPVVMVAYSDYQCPFCALWAQQTEPAMMELVEKGDLRIEWRDVNVFGPDSERGARAAYSAGLQDRFWEYHRALFADGEKPSADELSEEQLIALAGELGLDVDRFTADLASPEVAAAVQANEDEGLSIGAYSTPTFLVGGVPVVGAQPTEVFVQAVEDALAQAGS